MSSASVAAAALEWESSRGCGWAVICSVAGLVGGCAVRAYAECTAVVV